MYEKKREFGESVFATLNLAVQFSTSHIPRDTALHKSGYHADKPQKKIIPPLVLPLLFASESAMTVETVLLRAYRP